jgi:S1-C subfamily serine protease
MASRIYIGFNLTLSLIIVTLFAAKALAQPNAAHTRTTTSVKPAPASGISPEEAQNIRVYKAANRAVVNVNSVSVTEDMFYNLVPHEGVGSGTIISPDGLILTNFHVIHGADQVKVMLFDGSTYPGQLVGSDPDNDLAVLKIDVPSSKKLTVLPFGDSAELEVGRRVYAIGNPFGFDRTMSVGIVSSLGRTIKAESGRLIKGVIQTDAAINPGNSGGPLLNSAGKMIGITTAIISRHDVQQSSGIGLAIPINTAKRIIPELVAHHGVTRPDIGIELVELTDGGLRVIKLDPNGPAAKAGLSGPKQVVYRDGPFAYQVLDHALADIITGVDGVAVHSADDLLGALEQKKPGQVVTLTILRAGKSLRIPVKLAVVSPA